MSHSLPYEVNCSILFTELPLLERPAAAKAAGFDAVEFWWPFATAVPARRRGRRVRRAPIDDAGVQLIGLNFFAGDMPGGDRGLVSWPARSREFRDNIDVAVGIGERLGCTAFNALYGNRVDGVDAERAGRPRRSRTWRWPPGRRRASAAPSWSSRSAAPQRYPLLTAADALAVIDRVRPSGADNVGLLADLYHLAVNGDDVDARHRARTPTGSATSRSPTPPAAASPAPASWTSTAARPPRARPGYAGWVGLEYKPTAPTADSLDWLPRDAPPTQPPSRLTADIHTTHSNRSIDMTQHRLHRPRHHGQPDGRPPRQGRPRRRRLQPQPGQDRRRSSTAGGRGARSRSPRRSRDADVVTIMVPDSPDVAGRRSPARTASSPTPSRARWSSTSPASARTSPSELAETADGSGLPAARRPGLRRRGRAPSNAALSIMVGGDADDFDGRQAGPGRRRQDRRPRRPHRRRPDRQGRQPADRRRQHPGCSPRRSSSSRPTAWTPSAALEVLGGGLAGSKVLDQKGQNMLDRDFDARLPDRPAPQGPGHRHLRRPRGRRRHPARRARRPADGLAPCQRRRRPRPLRPARGVERSPAAHVRAATPATPDTRPATDRSMPCPHDAPSTPPWRSWRRRAPRDVFGLPGAAINPFYSRDARPRRASATSSPATSRAPRTWPRATPAPRPATSASASAPPARPAPT